LGFGKAKSSKIAYSGALIANLLCGSGQSRVTKAASHISAIERGQKELGVLLLFKIARFYGKTMERFLTGGQFYFPQPKDIRNYLRRVGHGDTQKRGQQ
jgi:transcriptional regulator with XRE-family HTH domain